MGIGKRQLIPPIQVPKIDGISGIGWIRGSHKYRQGAIRRKRDSGTESVADYVALLQALSEESRKD